MKNHDMAECKLAFDGVVLTAPFHISRTLDCGDKIEIYLSQHCVRRSNDRFFSRNFNVLADWALEDITKSYDALLSALDYQSIALYNQERNTVIWCLGRWNAQKQTVEYVIKSCFNTNWNEHDCIYAEPGQYNVKLANNNEILVGAENIPEIKCRQE